jgi:hypothetical protein
VHGTTEKTKGFCSFSKNWILCCGELFTANNGSGVNKILSGQMHQSKGLTLVKERLNLLNKSNMNSFQIESKLGIGTSITLQLEIPNYND